MFNTLATDNISDICTADASFLKFSNRNFKYAI